MKKKVKEQFIRKIFPHLDLINYIKNNEFAKYNNLMII